MKNYPPMLSVMLLLVVLCSTASTSSYVADAFLMTTKLTLPGTCGRIVNPQIRRVEIVPWVPSHKSPRNHGVNHVMNMALQNEGGNKNGIPSSPLDRPIVSVIDTVALLTFAAIGKASHNPDGSWDILGILWTALPFLLSWFTVAPLLGCFTPMATTSGDIKQSTISVAKGWIVAIPLGCLLRGAIKGYLPPIAFVIVTLIATLVLLSAGRAAYTAAAGLYMELF